MLTRMGAARLGASFAACFFERGLAAIVAEALAQQFSCF